MTASQRAATQDAVKALLTLIALYDIENPEERECKTSSIYYLVDVCDADTLEVLAHAIVETFSGDHRPPSVIILEALLACATGDRAGRLG